MAAGTKLRSWDINSGLLSSKPLFLPIPSISIFSGIQGKYPPLWLFLKPVFGSQETMAVPALGSHPVERGMQWGSGLGS